MGNLQLPSSSARSLQALHLTQEELAGRSTVGPSLELMAWLAGLHGALGALEDQGAGNDGVRHE